MKKIVESVKKKRCSPAGTKVVTLKVSQAWNNATMRDFERLVNIVLHEEQLTQIQVTEGCMCITWVAPADVQVEKIVDRDVVYNKPFMDAIAVLSLSIGDEEIYRRQDQTDTPVSLDSALLQAIEKGVIDAVELLLAVGANPYLSLPSGDAAISAIVNMRDEDGWTVLHSAYRHADVTSLFLCEGCDPNVVDNVGRTPIMVASKYGYCDTVATLIGAGADVNKATNTGTTPLIAAAGVIAAAGAGHDNIVATLIGAGADVNKVGGHHIPLTAAARAGHHNIVAILIGAGADVNKVGRRHIPLTAAARAGHDNIVATLIGAGAFDYKPIIDACSTGNNHLLQQLLLHPNINIDQEVNGGTPLVAAIKHNHPSIVTTLLLYGADPNVPVWYGMPLVIACEIGNKEIVQSLLQHNANVDYQDRRTGDTPLTVATKQEHNEIVQLLVEWGAGVDTEDIHMPHDQNIAADAEHLQPVPPSTDSQSSQSSLEGHCNSSAGNYSNISTATSPIEVHSIGHGSEGS